MQIKDKAKFKTKINFIWKDFIAKKKAKRTLSYLEIYQ